MQPLRNMAAGAEGAPGRGKAAGQRLAGSGGSWHGAGQRSPHHVLSRQSGSRRRAFTFGQPRRGDREHRARWGRTDAGVSAAGGRPGLRGGACGAVGSPSSSVPPSLLRGAASSAPLVCREGGGAALGACGRLRAGRGQGLTVGIASPHSVWVLRSGAVRWGVYPPVTCIPSSHCGAVCGRGAVGQVAVGAQRGPMVVW